MNKDILRLYAVTDRGCIGERDFYETIEQALAGGVTLLQLREKHLPEDALIEESVRMKEICRRYDVPLIINDHYRAALEAGADGVHVGIEDAPVAEIRRLAGTNFIIGATSKTIEQAKKAEAEGADYLGVGAVFPSPTKTNAVRITPEKLKEICASVQIPVVAIGGITEENILQLSGYGMDGAAIVSAIFSAQDIEQTCRRLLALSEQIVSMK